jgi:hypothetical protein
MLPLSTSLASAHTPLIIPKTEEPFGFDSPDMLFESLSWLETFKAQ